MSAAGTDRAVEQAAALYHVLIAGLVLTLLDRRDVARAGEFVFRYRHQQLVWEGLLAARNRFLCLTVLQRLDRGDEAFWRVEQNPRG